MKFDSLPDIPVERSENKDKQLYDNLFAKSQQSFNDEEPHSQKIVNDLEMSDNNSK